MADRIAEPDDVAVDELKRKARRRLVGAVVLALAAAIIVPMLLEREPRPLGDEVSVQIPPVDDGKFVNRLTPKGEAAPKGDGKTKPDASSAPITGGAAPKSIADAEQRVLAAPPPPSATPPTIPADEKAGSTASAKSESAPPSPAPATKVEPAKIETPKVEAAKPDAATSASPAKADAKSASAPPKTEPKADDAFVVQLAAFADDKGANALAGKLKRAGYPAFTEPVQTSRGTLWRVRVGSYPSREAATDARGKLKADGYSGIVAATR